MTALPQISKFIDSKITEGDFKVALSELRDYLSGLLGDDGKTGTARATLKIPLSAIVEKTADTTAKADDTGKVLRFSGSAAITLTLDAAMSLGAGWNLTVINDSSTDLVIAPYVGELIDGQETLILGAGLRTGIVCDGTRLMTTYKQEKPEIPDIPGAGMQIFTASGTFTPPVGVRKVMVFLIGGGGGGGGSDYMNPTAGGTSSFGAAMTATGGGAGSRSGSIAGAGGYPLGVAGNGTAGAPPPLFGYGAGGTGTGSYSGGGGGGGGVAIGFVDVTPGVSVSVTVGAGGSADKKFPEKFGGSGLCIVIY